MPEATRQPRGFHLSFALILTGLMTFGLWWLLGAKSGSTVWIVAWLVSINIVAFAYFAFDKNQAVNNARRVPEIVLHCLSLAGGSPGAFLSMHLFRHKTIKGGFRILFWCIVVLQVALVAWFVKLHWFS